MTKTTGVASRLSATTSWRLPPHLSWRMRTASVMPLLSKGLAVDGVYFEAGPIPLGLFMPVLVKRLPIGIWRCGDHLQGVVHPRSLIRALKQLHLQQFLARTTACQPWRAALPPLPFLPNRIAGRRARAWFEKAGPPPLD